jgi:hypothetical protein
MAELPQRVCPHCGDGLDDELDGPDARVCGACRKAGRDLSGLSDEQWWALLDTEMERVRVQVQQMQDRTELRLVTLSTVTAGGCGFGLGAAIVRGTGGAVVVTVAGLVASLVNLVVVVWPHRRTHRVGTVLIAAAGALAFSGVGVLAARGTWWVAGALMGAGVVVVHATVRYCEWRREQAGT